MAEWELVQDRVLSGRGVLQIPTDAIENRAYALFVDVIREPTSKYLNFAYNPPRSRYGNIVFLRDSYAINTLSVEYKRQVYDGINDVSGQTLNAVKCAYDGILQSFVNLGIALNVVPTGVTNSISAYQNLRLSWNEARIVCYADTALQVRLYRIIYDICDTQNDQETFPPPPAAPIAEVSPGTPVINSLPYDEATFDNGNSVPFPGDEPEILPSTLGGECQSGTLTFDYVYVQNGQTFTGSQATTCYGPVSTNFRVKEGIEGVLETECRGQPFNQACQPYAYRDILSLGAGRVVESWSNIAFS